MIDFATISKMLYVMRTAVGWYLSEDGRKRAACEFTSLSAPADLLHAVQKRPVTFLAPMTSELVLRELGPVTIQH